MPSCPTFMMFAVVTRDRAASGGRDATALSSFHTACNHRSLHVDFKHPSAFWNGSRFLRRPADTVDDCSRLLAFRGKPEATSEGPSILRKQVADIRRVGNTIPRFAVSNPANACRFALCAVSSDTGLQ